GVAGVAFVGPAVVNLPLLLDEPVLYFAGFATGALIPIALLAVGMTSTMRAEERRRAAWGAEWVSKAEARSAAEQAAMNFGKPIEGSAGGQR
ncbi:MAG TPA: hypothetical protein VML96_10230, partial [Egibacteraceae bacterium]|nr:hypothetical protein [Egibacteraceae bacterium]